MESVAGILSTFNIDCYSFLLPEIGGSPVVNATLKGFRLTLLRQLGLEMEPVAGILLLVIIDCWLIFCCQEIGYRQWSMPLLKAQD
jgi:hypothetical protein